MLKKIREGILRAKAWMLDYAFVMTLGAAAAIAVASAMATNAIRQENAQLIEAAAPAQEIQTTQTPKATLAPLPTFAPYQPIRLGGSTVRPVSGEELRVFSQDTPVFWETLCCMKTHPALDIAGASGEEVRCAMDGTIDAVTLDALWGYSVCVAQTDGAEAVYRGLESLCIAEGAHITRGQSIGVLMPNVPCEAELEPHLHLEVWREGRAEDPGEMLPEMGFDVAK